jgi:hypothetical protein
MKTAIGDDPIDEDADEETEEETSVGELISEEERDLLVKRLAACGLPTREIVWISGASGRTVARVMQRWGIVRKRSDGFPTIKTGYARGLPDILRQYYIVKEVTLDSLQYLAKENSISLKRLLDLIRENVSPSRWAIRSCLGTCGQFVLTSSPADRYCITCKIKLKKNRKGIREDEIYG